MTETPGNNANMIDSDPKSPMPKIGPKEEEEEEAEAHAGDESPAEAERRYALLRSIRSEGGAEKFVQTLSQQLLLQHDANWGDLLGAAPQALCFLGQCFVAATSSSAVASLELPNEDGLLKEKSLRSNLVHCSDLGRKAFMSAESKLNKVHLITTHICETRGPIDRIMSLLDDEELAKLDLQRQLDRLRKYSQNCVRDAEQVKESFEAWQNYALQIRRACTSADDRVQSETVAVQNKIAIANSAAIQQGEEKDRTEKEMNNFRSHVEIHKQEFQKASKDMPIGWNALAQDAVGRFINVMPNVLAMASVMQPWNPFRGYKQPSDDHEDESQPEMPNPLKDWGFGVSDDILRHLNILKKQLHAGDLVPPDFGVSWNSLYADNRSSGALIDDILGYFRRIKEQAPSGIGKLRSSSSKEAMSILDDVIDVAEEIYENKEAQKSIRNAPPSRDKGTIMSWRERISSACVRNDDLGMDLKKAKADYDEYLKDRKERGSRRKQIKKGKDIWLSRDNVQVARENLQASQRALLESEKLLSEEVDRHAESRRKFNEGQLQLDKLNAENINMQQIIAILKGCVENLTEFQEHLGKLVQFFSGLTQFIDVIHEGHALEFLAQVDNTVKIVDDRKHEDQKKRDARKKELMDSLLVDALNLKGNYLVAGEMASVYVDISRKHILPGVNTVERLGLNSDQISAATSTKRANQILSAQDSTPAAKADTLLRYARRAASDISKIAEKRREKLREELFIQDREVTELGRMIEDAELSSKYKNEWDEA